MSVIHTNNITNKDGTSGPTISGITNVSSSGFMQVPVGDTFRRQVLENVVDSGLVLYLDAGNNISYPGSGTTWTDLSGESRNVSVSESNFYQENNGYFDYSGGTYTNTGVTGDEFFEDNGGTIMLWINPDDIETRQTLVSGYISGDSDRWDYEISDGKFRGGAHDDTISVFSNQQLKQNNWVHLTVTLDTIPTNNVQKFYINGQLDKNYEQSTNRDWKSSAVIGIARRTSSIITSYDGKISQILFYNRPLSASEVLQNYNATKYRYEN